MRNAMGLPLIFSALMLESCTSIIAPASSSVRPDTYWVYQVCVPGHKTFEALIASPTPSSNGRLNPTSLVARTTNGQSIFEGIILNGGAGIVFKEIIVPNSGTDSFYVFPSKLTPGPEWSPWLPPDEIAPELPRYLDRLHQFRKPGKDQLANAPKIRWRAEGAFKYSKSSRVHKQERYAEIPPC